MKYVQYTRKESCLKRTYSKASEWLPAPCHDHLVWWLQSPKQKKQKQQICSQHHHVSFHFPPFISPLKHIIQPLLICLLDNQRTTMLRAWTLLAAASRLGCVISERSRAKNGSKPRNKDFYPMSIAAGTGRAPCPSLGRIWSWTSTAGITVPGG
jgi:hypothetical protein